jgi:hypothetical protein
MHLLYHTRTIIIRERTYALKEMIVSRGISLVWIVIISLTLIYPHIYEQIFAASYNVENTTISDTTTSTDSSLRFPNQEIIDPNLDWIDIKTKTFTKDGDRSTDIISVDYYSDGNTLNAILWLYFPFKAEPPSSYENVNYGMYVDADFDETTGYGGIEYKVEISWNNQSKVWTKVLEKWSHFGETIVLENQTIPYTNFSKKGAHYVWLTADLDSMLSPKKYKAIFYGEVGKDGSLKTDFTRMIANPPLEVFVSTSPNSVELRKDERKTIEVRINVTQGYEPTVNLYATSPSKHLIFDFTQNDTLDVPVYTLRIPSHGIGTIPLTVFSPENAPVGPSTLFIFANSSFPPEEFVKPKQLQSRSSNFLPASILTSENIFTRSTLLVSVTEPFTLIDIIDTFWSKVGGALSFFYGVLAGISPWIITKIKEQRRRNS